MANDFFLKMTKEAIEELASGEKGWREASPNTIIMAGFGMLFNHLASRLVKPLWWFAGTCSTGLVAWVIFQILG